MNLNDALSGRDWLEKRLTYEDYNLGEILKRTRKARNCALMHILEVRSSIADTLCIQRRKAEEGHCYETGYN